MIRGNAMTNTTNPPGQVAFSKEKRFWDIRPQEVAKPIYATTPLPDVEKRLERVLEALSGLARQAELRQATSDGWWAQELRKIVKENA